MCAIAGIIGLSAEEAAVRTMLETMRRRGPDGQGVFASPNCTLLHTRLAVIDPEGGAQPMTLQYGAEEYTIVYNGELYNTSELRQELQKSGHRNLTSSDTEVLLHGYAEFGAQITEKCNGIFAFAVWEKRARRLFLARDRMGVKPLFFMRHRGGFLFASEMKTILRYPGVRAMLDSEGAAELLLLGPGRTPGCGVFAGMRELEPGCRAVFAHGRLALERYWQLTDREHRESFDETADHVRFLVCDAIKRQMVSDVPLGTFLSGGLDSSLITAVCARDAAKEGRLLPTFSVDYENNERYFVPNHFQPNSDAHYIRLMCDALQTDHHWCILSADDLAAELDDGTLARDLPGMADVDLSLLAFCREIKREVTVALSGECADEIFGGYPWYRDPEIRAQAGFPWSQNLEIRKALLAPAFAQKLDAEEYVHSRYAQTIAQTDVLPGTSAQERRMKELVNLNFRWFMQTLLDRKDRMSMFSGLEVRVPFCDYRIAEYLYGVPWEMKDWQGKEKGLLRYAMRGLLPEEVLWRKKSPYPKTFDPAYTARMEERLHGIMQDDSPLFQLVSRTAVERLLESELSVPWYGQLMRRAQLICYLCQIDSWFRQYGVQIAF